MQSLLLALYLFCKYLLWMCFHPFCSRKHNGELTSSPVVAVSKTLFSFVIAYLIIDYIEENIARLGFIVLPYIYIFLNRYHFSPCLVKRIVPVCLRIYIYLIKGRKTNLDIRFGHFLTMCIWCFLTWLNKFQWHRYNHDDWFAFIF